MTDEPPNKHPGSTDLSDLSGAQSAPGLPGEPGIPGLPGSEPRPRRRKWPIITALIGVMAFIAAAAGIVVVTKDDDYPDRWSPRVREFVDIVEDSRGLKFRHPIPVDFLSDKEFEKSFAVDQGELTKEDKESETRTTKLLRAVGLVDGEVKISEAVEQLGNETVLGLYEPDKDRIKVRGKQLTPSVRATLVHELTHVLQFQHFPINKLEEKANSTEVGAIRALLEGDANRIEGEYVDTFSESEFNDFSGEQESFGEAADLSEVPDVLTTIFGFPYTAGDILVGILNQNGGNSRINRAFQSPPKTDEHLLDPYTYLRRDKAETVALPKLKRGEQRVEEETEDDFGAVLWLLMLGERIDGNLAVSAADGWGGDASIVFTKPSPEGDASDKGEKDEKAKNGKAQRTTCVRAAFRGETRNDTAEMVKALYAWQETMPSGATGVEENSKVVTLTACDPGSAGAAKVTGNHQAALTRYLARIQFTMEVVATAGAEVSVPVARCAADRLIAGFTDEQISSDDVEALGPDFAEKAQQTFLDCSNKRTG